MTAVVADPEHIHRVSLRDKEFRLLLPDFSTDAIQKHIAQSGQVYEPGLVEDVLDRCPPGSVIIDVGANIGNHTIAWASAGGCSVVAYEPNPRLAELIRQSAALNHVQDRVRVMQTAVGESESVSRLVVSDPSNLGGGRLVDVQEPASSEREEDVSEGYEVQVAPLDPPGGPIGVIKIDVEGFEVAVLRGAAGLIAEHHPLLYVECLDFQHFNEILELVSELGYAYEETFNASPTHRFAWTGTAPAPAPTAVLNLARRMYSDHAAYLSTRESLLSANQKYRAAGTTVDNLKERIRLLEATASPQGISPADLTLHGQLADALQLIRRLEGELLHAKSQSSQWSQALAERDETVQRLVREHSELSSENRGLQTEVEKLTAAKQALTAEREALTKIVEGLRSDAEQADACLRSAHEDLDDRDRELAALREEVGRVIADLQSLRTSADRWRLTEQRLESAYFDELTRLEYTQDQLAFTGLRLGEERQRAEDLRLRAELLEAEVGRRTTELERDNLRRRHHAKDMATLRTWVAERQEAEDSLTVQLAETVATAESDLGTLRDVAEAHSRAAAHFKAEAAGLHEAIREERRATQRARQDLERAVQELAGVAQELADAAEQNELLSQQVDWNRRQCSEAVAALQRLRRSKTYLAGVEVRNSRSLVGLATLPSRLARVARTADPDDETKELSR